MRERMAERALAMRRTADQHDDAAQALQVQTFVITRS
jgi:hypothetical protein